MDKYSIDKINLLHPKLRDEALTIYNEISVALIGKARCRFLSTLRTFAEQDSLYQQGRTKSGAIVTNAKAGKSFHNYGLAIDIVLLIDTNNDGIFESSKWDIKTDFDGDKIPDWIEAVNIFKQHGWEWGGNWKFTDYPHFQKVFNMSVNDCLTLYNSGKVDKNNYILI